jgi:hypothetical protein
MALNAIYRRFYSGHPPAPSPGPYKSPRAPPEQFAPHRTLSSSSPALERAPTEPDRRRTSDSAAPSIPRLSSSEEPTKVLAAASSTSPAPSPATLIPGVAGGRNSDEPPTAGPPWTGAPVVHGPVDSVYGISLMKIIRYFREFCKEAPVFLCNQPAVQEITIRPGNLKNNSKKVPSLRKIHKNSSKIPKIHIFPTTTLNPVILAPKFLESLSLSFYAFIFHMFVAFIDRLYVFTSR